MEIFDELVESEVAIIAPHIKSLIELCLEVGLISFFPFSVFFFCKYQCNTTNVLNIFCIYYSWLQQKDTMTN